jgi:pimeloyl-ACP methyl ester carboxylesterase
MIRLLAALLLALAPADVPPPAAQTCPADARGLTFVADRDEHLPLGAFIAACAAAAAPPRVVVLVHGLDDPGWMWRDVIPALRAAGHVVARMEYRNDGPITAAADRFALELEKMRRAGVRHIDVVAHSMGGLVTRDVLTRAEHYAGDGTGGARFPAIDRLVMCGTPNHGSKMARLRAISEIKEQVSRALSGNGTLLGGLSDGRGEAEADLLPGSAFLRDLNGRRPCAHTAMTIVAGRMSPLESDDVADLADRLRRTARSANAPKWLTDLLDDVECESADFLDEAVRGVGDGCVTLDSARLGSVDDVEIVEANHVSMIVNVVPGSAKVPPAIPIILERLREQADPREPDASR